MKIYQSNHPTRGLLTGLTTVVLNAMSGTPVVKSSDLKSALIAVNHKYVEARFNWFTFQDILWSIPEVIEGLGLRDPPGLLMQLGIRPQPKKRARNRKATTQFTNSDYSSQYPLGRHPTWPQIQKGIEDDADQLMAPMQAAETLHATIADLDPRACEIYIAFTRNAWMALRDDHFVSRKNMPQVLSVLDALNSWSVAYITRLTRKESRVFIASYAGLKGKLPGAPMAPFSTKWDVFFPENSPKEGSQMHLFFTTEGGYLNLYNRDINDENGDNTGQIKESLSALFQMSQCMPVPGKQSIWKSSHQVIEFLTNSSHYRIESIATTGAHRGTRSMGANKPTAMIQKLMNSVSPIKASESLVHQTHPSLTDQTDDVLPVATSNLEPAPKHSKLNAATSMKIPPNKRSSRPTGRNAKRRAPPKRVKHGSNVGSFHAASYEPIHAHLNIILSRRRKISLWMLIL